MLIINNGGFDESIIISVQDSNRVVFVIEKITFVSGDVNSGRQKQGGFLGLLL